MKFSAPIYRLKHRARTRSRELSIPLHQALDDIAGEEGFSSWSLLVARAEHTSPAKVLLQQLSAGEMLLLGARPGHGKTLLALELAVAAMADGHNGVFFSLDYSEADMLRCFRSIDVDPAAFEQKFQFDNSAEISAEYIMRKLAAARPGTVVIIDYLQELDQKRSNPELSQQIAALRAFAKAQRLTLVFISQIDQRFDTAQRKLPTLADVRLPNPLDLGLFSKACFLHDGEVQLASV